VTSQARLIAAPEIPTAVEAGLPGMVLQQLIALFVPAQSPRALIEQIGQAARKGLAAFAIAAVAAAQYVMWILNGQP
jgi:tripartite-type tricarboxylate transporter receptor subunit TctC